MGAAEAKNYQIVVPAGVQGRLDLWLSSFLKLSRSQIKRLIDRGLITVNGVTVKAGYSLQPGDEIFAAVPKRPKPSLEPENIMLDIVYEDEDLAVVNKPKGLVVHPSAGNWQGTLVNALLFHFPRLAKGSGKYRPGIVHRLDKDTSGLMLVAKNDASYNHLLLQFKKRLVRRHYLALVQGVLRQAEGFIDKPIGRHPKNRKKMAVLEGGRRAYTSYTVLERFHRHSLLLCRLKTGRTHQIRVHLAGIHHPLVGDVLYGFRSNNLGAKSQVLHAFYLGFTHPSGRFMEFESEPPLEFKEILRKARLIN
ncbi:MAG TPA: RluA family pseudouridine synthase [Firmicutes bacterium]|nr:RluA family pseudouridine synthase [Bacillota bacterium]